MAREPQWVELQPLTTLYLKAATDGVTQPVEHYLNTQGFDVADMIVEVFAVDGAASPYAEVRLETGPQASARPLFEDATASPRTSVFQEAASTDSAIDAIGIYPLSTVWNRDASDAPLQRWLRWSVVASTTGVHLTFRIHGVLREQ